MDRMAGLALAGAGVGGAGLAVAGLTGYLPVSKQQELEQLKALNMAPPPELEQQARDEQIAQWGTAALAVGAGTGLGLLVDRFAGSPEVVEKVKKASAGGGVSPTVGHEPESPSSGGWMPSGRLATEEEARGIVNLMVRHVSSDPLTMRWDKNAITHIAERIKSTGAAELGTALDYIDANLDGKVDNIEGLRRLIDRHVLESSPAAYQRMVDSVTPEIIAARHEDDSTQEALDELHHGRKHDYGIGLLDKVILSPSSTPAERRLAAAGRVMVTQDSFTNVPQETLAEYLQALEVGDAGGYQDRQRGNLEYHGLDPYQFRIPDWALNYKGNGGAPAPYKTVDELLAHEIYTDDYRRKAGLEPLSNEQIMDNRRLFEFRDKHRRLRLGVTV